MEPYPNNDPDREYPAFTMILNPGAVLRGGDDGTHDVNYFVKIEFDGKNLSFTGVEGPRRNGDCAGSCGQARPADNLIPKGEWRQDKIYRLDYLWDRWHLNTMRAGCAHQREEGWHLRKIDASKPLRAYGRFLGKDNMPARNMLTWVRPSEHPDGLLTKPCDTCGWKYGSGWAYEQVPTEVLDEIRKFPESEIKPAWI